MKAVHDHDAEKATEHLGEETGAYAVCMCVVCMCVVLWGVSSLLVSSHAKLLVYETLSY